jgi:hypothetical protein
MNCANHPDRASSAFCQNCGKPLCPECMRSTGTQIFCEPCFAARAAAPAADPAAAYPGTSAGPSPGLAALLGFIPGVGAMYNGQYAKGIVHLMIFAVLVSLSGENGMFGLFVSGWVFYMVIEAYHTARARRDGTPVPNPFGLNDLGERLGFGRSWPHPPGPGGSAPGATYARGTADPFTAPGAPAGPPPTGQPYTYQYSYTPPASWGAPQDVYTAVPPATEVPPRAEVPPYGTAPPYAAVPVPDAQIPGPSRIPAGAIWLIALGVLFLLGNTGLFWIRARFIGPLLLIAFGVWVFIRRMTETGLGIENDGTPQYAWRLASAARISIWLVTTGFLWLLDVVNVLPWSRSWPLLLIIGGIMLFLRRSIVPPPYSAPYPGSGYPPYPPYPPPAPPPPPAGSTAIVPASDSNAGTREVR